MIMFPVTARSGFALLVLAALTACISCREEMPQSESQPAVELSSGSSGEGRTLTSGPASSQEEAASVLNGTTIGPHKGRLLAISPDVGFIEWSMSSRERKAQAYFLDPRGRPLKGVADASLVLEQPAGPFFVPLADCGDPEWRNACGFTAIPDLLEEQPPGLVRFRIGGRGYRVVLPTTRPVG